METTRLSSKGQIVLPKSVRENRHWPPGTEFAVEEIEEGVLLKPVKQAKHFRSTTYEEVEGCLKYRGRPRTVKDMEEGIARITREGHVRGRY